MHSFSALALLALVSLSSALQVVPDQRFTRVVKRSPGQIGSIPFKFSGMAKRSQDGTHEFVERALATPPKIQIGTSNPAPGAVNTLSDVEPVSGDSDGSMNDFDKRQAGTQPKVVIGTSNPIAPASSKNQLDPASPTAGGNGGVLSSFKEKRSLKARLDSPKNLAKRQATKGKVVLGTSNPVAPESVKNNLDVAAPTVGTNGGGMADFKKRQINLVSHNVATRGLADGTIEVIPSKRDSFQGATIEFDADFE